MRRPRVRIWMMMAGVALCGAVAAIAAWGMRQSDEVPPRPDAAIEFPTPRPIPPVGQPPAK
jgi:hypothetical protein